VINVPANDHGAIYVIELNRPAPEGLEDKTDAAIMAVFGNVVLNTDYIDVIAPGVLTDMSLPDLIRNGYDMQLSPTDAVEIDGLIGSVVLVMSAAFPPEGMTLDLPADVRLVTVLRDTPDVTLPETLRSDAAKGSLQGNGKPKKSDARIGGMIATYALLLMFALVGLMVWIGG
jgi:hypothetical protein